MKGCTAAAVSNASDIEEGRSTEQAIDIWARETLRQVTPPARRPRKN